MKQLTLDELQFKSGLGIVRLAPADQSVTIEYWNPENIPAITVTVMAGESRCREISLEAQTVGTITLYELDNNVDYTVFLEGCGVRSPERLFRCGYVPGTVINYIHPEDYTYNLSGRSPATPCILRLNSGTLLASHDVFWLDGGQNLSLVFASEDNGQSWHYRSLVFPCFWGKLFLHRGKLYIMGISTEYGALQIFCSEDEGRTWSEPCQILAAGDKFVGGPHKSAMPIVECAGRLWTGIDYGSWTIGGHKSGAVSISVDADLMDSKNWTATGFLPYDPQWEGTVQGKSGGLLEGNMIVGPDGELYNLLRYQTNGCVPNVGKAILLHYQKDAPAAMPEFYKVVDFYGNLSKFTVLDHKESQTYYALVNRVISPNIGQRNCLSLVASKDLVHWELRRDVLNYQDNGWHEDHTKAAFQYVDFIYDDKDILFVSRTALNGAFSFHNANYLTFHRLQNFEA